MKTISTLLALALGLAVTSANAAVLYSENFNNASNYALNNFGWGAHVTSTALTNSGPTEPTNWTILNGGNGSPVTDLANVNAGTTPDANTATTPSRTSLNTSGSGSGPAISWTNEFTLDRSAFTLDSIDFAIGNNNSAINTRVAVQVGGSWYVTSATFNQTTPPASSSNISAYESKSFTWTNAAASWRSLSFDGTMTVSSGVATTAAGTNLTLGSVLGSDLSGGNVSAFGLFYDSFAANQSARTNIFTINATAIPEPTTYVLLAGSLAALAILRRRRQA